MDSQRGLTLGKFAPCHKGHQFLIETALSQMDEVIIIIYDARETTSVPLNIRTGWIRRLYPKVQVIKAWDGPTEVGDTPEIKKKHENYILNRLKLQGITHFYSSEFYGWSVCLLMYRIELQSIFGRTLTTCKMKFDGMNLSREHNKTLLLL
jgi:hypothetical protein